MPTAPIGEDDPVSPLGAYGRSKLLGERAVAAAHPDHAILRTSWIYSPFGKNFVKTMLRLARDRDEVSVVADQLGSPTSAHDIADGIVTVCRNLLARPAHSPLRGIFHMSASGSASVGGIRRRDLCPIGGTRRPERPRHPDLNGRLSDARPPACQFAAGFREDRRHPWRDAS